MASYNNNRYKTIVNDLNVTSLNNNSGLITVTCRSCSIVSVKSNHGKISVAELSSVGAIKGNTGKIDLMSGSNIGSIEQNSGKISTGSSAFISAIKNNYGKIAIEDNSTIDLVCENMGKIQLGNNCVINNVIGNGGNIQCGVGCHVPVTVPSSSNPPASSFSFYMGNAIITGTNATGAFLINVSVAAIRKKKSSVHKFFFLIL